MDDTSTIRIIALGRRYCVVRSTVVNGAVQNTPIDGLLYNGVAAARRVAAQAREQSA